MAIDYEYRGSATVTPDLTEYNKLQAKADVKAGEAGNIGTAGRVVGSAAATAYSEYEKAQAEDKDKKDTVDAHIGMTEERTVMMELEANNDPAASEQYMRIQQQNLEADFLNGKISKGTFQGRMAVLKSKEEKAYKEGQELTDKKIANVEKSGMVSKLADNDYSKEDYNYLVKDRGMSPKAALALLRDSIYEVGIGGINSSTNSQSLKESQEWSSNMFKKAFEGNNYIGSRDWNTNINSLEAKRKAAVTAKQKQFKQEAMTRINLNLQDKYPLAIDTQQLMQDYVEAYGDNPDTFYSKLATGKTKVQTKWDESHIDEYGFDSRILDNQRKIYQDNKEYAESTFSSQLTTALLTGDLDSANDIVHNGYEYSEAWGQDMLNMINTAKTTQEIEPFLQGITAISNTGGGFMLNKALGAQSLADTTTTYYVAKYEYDGDLTKARQKINSNYGQPAKPNYDPATNEAIGKYATELQASGMSSVYRATLNAIAPSSPEVAEAVAKDLASYFKEMQTSYKLDYDKGSFGEYMNKGVVLDTEFFSPEVQVNMSAGPDYIKDKTYRTDGGNDAYKNIMYKLQGTYGDFTRLSYIGTEGMAIITDHTGLSKIVDVKPYMDDYNYQYSLNPETKSAIIPTMSSAAVDIFSGLLEVPGKFGSNIGKTFKQSEGRYDPYNKYTDKYK